MLNTGSARYGVSITVPPGTAGHAPSLTLQYDSGYGFGPAGIGWRFGPGAISRQTDKGLPRYVDSDNGEDDDFDFVIDEPDEKDTYTGPDGEELVEVEPGIFRARIEGAFVRYRKVDDHWEADLGSGTVLTFGSTPDARVADAGGARVFKWLLEKNTDVNGNTIEYRYTSFPDSDNQKYLREIRYGPGAPPWSTFYFIHFSYEQRPDGRIDYRSGFPIKTEQRLTDIHIGIQGAAPAQCAAGDWNEDTTPDSLIGRYELSYTAAHPNSSHLHRITRYGSDGINYLPPLSFAYSTTAPPAVISAAGQITASSNAPATVMDSELVDLIDLNRDGLPDMLRTDAGGGSHTCYLNLGVNDEAVTGELTWSSGQLVGSADGLAHGLQLAEDRVNVADMDGDGIADLVHTTDFGQVHYYKNSGEVSWEERRSMSITDQVPPAPFLSADVKTADLDFDKRMDVVQSTDSGYSIWFNLEEGIYSRRVQVAGPRHQGQVLRFSQTGVHLADMNGDRLADVVRITPTAVIYAASMGYGSFALSESISIPGTILEDGENSQLSRARLEDVNNDGLADLVVERAAANHLWCWLNEGTNSFSERYTITDMPSQFGPDTVVRWADLNGNSTTDLVYGDSTASERVRMLDIGALLNGSAHTNMLLEIANGLGAATEITYRSSTSHYLRDWAQGLPWSTSMPFPVQVVSEVATVTGLDSDTVPGADRYIKQYRYRDGYYEDREKQFRGFGEVQVIEWGDDSAPTRVTNNGFFTGGPDGIDNDGDTDIDEMSPQNHREEDALKGSIRFIESRTATGTLFRRTENDWLVRTLPVSPPDTEIRFAYNTETNRHVYEHTASPETMQTTYAYDDLGNTTETKNYGALSITGDELFSYTEYINDTTTWILHKEQRRYQTGADHITVAETRSYYDGPDYVGLGYGSLTNGMLTRREGWVEGATWVDLIRNGYDSYGNVTSMMNPNGFLRTVTYDPALHSYPEQETLEVGGGSPDLSISAAYNIGLGAVTASIDFNGNSHFFGHDVFSRLTLIVRPGDSQGLPGLTFSYKMADSGNGLVYAYDPDGALTLTSEPPQPSSVTTRARETPGESGTYDTTVYVDGLGRTLGTVEEGEEGFIVSGSPIFNSLGTVRYAYPPHASATDDYAKPLLSDPAEETFYDALGRVILRNNLPDENDLITGFQTAYLPLQRIETDENGHVKRYASDGLEQLIRVDEENDGDVYTTVYDYDPLSRLKTITDAQGNVRTMEYDGLGRRILLLDPDRGRMEYIYDAASNLTQTIDNKAQTITYSYDGADRMRSEDYLDAAGITPDVAYHYDNASPDYPAAANLNGRLSWVNDLSGATFFSYDERGNPVWTVKRIDDDGAVADHLSQFAYDALDRPVSAIYPDSSAITYQYNRRSLLDSIPGIIANIDYHPSGRRSSITYANGLTTTYGYDPRYRLKHLRTDLINPTGSPVQDLSYGFDGVSNITAISDNRLPAAAVPENASQSFAYDDLDRLIRAEGPGYGRIYYDYDSIGNMTLKQSPPSPSPLHIDDPLVNLGVMTSGGAGGTSGRGVKLPGTDPGPHAVTSTASGLLFDYDDNGNMTANDGDTYSWDFRDRMVGSEVDGAPVSYHYDYRGQRVIKKSATGTVHYIGKLYEIRDGRPIRYVFDGSRRVARIEAAPADGEPADEAISLYPGWNFFSLTVEPDDPAITSVLSSVSFSELWRYNQASARYEGYVPGEGRTDFSDIHAGRGYIVLVDAAATLLVSGTKSTGSVDVETGWNFIPGFVELPTSVDLALTDIAGSFEQVWDYDAAGSSWRRHQPGLPPFLNNLDAVRPGSACWIKMAEPGQISFQNKDDAIRFYHSDHLGSSNVVTDMKGAVVERSEFYPFGAVRHEQRRGFESVYKFTGKEKDRETGLNYFEARYYLPYVGKFISVDPYTSFHDNSVHHLKNSTAYSYVNNQPVILIDPSGMAQVIIEEIAPDISSFDRDIDDQSTPHMSEIVEEVSDALTAGESVDVRLQETSPDRVNLMYGEFGGPFEPLEFVDTGTAYQYELEAALEAKEKNDEYNELTRQLETGFDSQEMVQDPETGILKPSAEAMKKYDAMMQRLDELNRELSERTSICTNCDLSALDIETEDIYTDEE